MPAVPGLRNSHTTRRDDGIKLCESQGLSVDFFSSFFIVPSGDSVTRFSFFSTVPSLLTFSLSVSEMVRSQPIVSTDSARADIIAIKAVLRVFIVPRFNVAVFLLV